MSFFLSLVLKRKNQSASRIPWIIMVRKIVKTWGKVGEMRKRIKESIKFWKREIKVILKNEWREKK